MAECPYCNINFNSSASYAAHINNCSFKDYDLKQIAEEKGTNLRNLKKEDLGEKAYYVSKKQETEIEAIKADTANLQTKATSLQSSKLDNTKNIFAGLTQSIVSNYGSTGTKSNVVTNGILASSKDATPSAQEGVDILIDLSSVPKGELKLQFDYNDFNYVAISSTQLGVILATTTGTFKKTIGALLSTFPASGTYILDLTADVRTYGLQAGFIIRLATRDAYSINISNFKIITSVKSEVNELKGKTFLACGDSVGKGEGSGDYSFFDMIAGDNGMTLTKVCVSGSTVSIRDGHTDSILEQLRAHAGYYDYIGIEGVFNDMFQAITLGALSTGFEAVLDETTFYGAMEALCKELVIYHYTSKFFFVLGHKKPRTSNQDTYWDAAIIALEKWGIPYVDLRKKSTLAAYNDTQGTALFAEAEGTHPLKHSYRTGYVPPVLALMRSI